MLCPSCKKETPDDSKFCQYCGKQLLVEPAGDEGKKKKSKAPVLIVLSIVLLITGLYIGTWLAARKCAETADFGKARSLLLFPALTELHDPWLNDFIDAGLLFSNGEYSAARVRIAPLRKEDYLHASLLYDAICYYQASDFFHRDGDSIRFKQIVDMAKSGNLFAEEALREETEYAYICAVKGFNNGRLYYAENIFSIITPYRDSEKYLEVINQTLVEQAYHDLT